MNRQLLAVNMINITRKFPGVVANDSVNFKLARGEIHALLGENGAGKTTLVNCLYGIYQYDEGMVLINDRKVDITSPGIAIENGIGMVHQHFMLIPPFTVTENIILGSEPTQNLMIDMKKAVKEVTELSERYGLNVEPEAKVRDISVGMQQRVEILKALYRGADILIFDEPTAVLTPQEVDELVNIMKNLTEEGKSIIFITHKIKEVKMIADRVTVIRRGKVIDTVETRKTTENKLARMMADSEVLLKVDKKPVESGEVILEVKNLRVKNDRNILALNGTSFNLKKGEILGIAGVDGNGQSELVEVLTGLRKFESGKIILKGEELKKIKTKKLFKAGVSHIPEDRQKRGLIMEHTLFENLILGNHYRPPYAKFKKMNYKRIKDEARELIDEYDIRTPGENVKVKTLSDGNQQKIILAREFNRKPDILIAAQPTRGVDVGAIEFIHNKLIELRDTGNTILLISLELDEILSLSDRIAVIYEGKIVDILAREEATEERLGLLMSGATSEGGPDNG